MALPHPELSLALRHRRDRRPCYASQWSRRVSADLVKTQTGTKRGSRKQLVRNSQWRRRQRRSKLCRTDRRESCAPERGGEEKIGDGRVKIGRRKVSLSLSLSAKSIRHSGGERRGRKVIPYPKNPLKRERQWFVGLRHDSELKRVPKEAKTCMSSLVYRNVAAFKSLNNPLQGVKAQTDRYRRQTDRQSGEEECFCGGGGSGWKTKSRRLAQSCSKEEEKNTKLGHNL